MDVNFKSKNISLLFDCRPEGYGNFMDDLWRTLRRDAVEAGQASSPDLTSFADECLLCAHIVTNVASDQEEDMHVAETPDALWTTHLPRNEWHAPSTSTPTPDVPTGARVGLIYLHAGPANIPAGEANIGVAIKPDMRRRGYAREAVQLVLRWAFEEFKFHRVQAAILDTQCRDRAMRTFIGCGFSHEGTKRRAVFQPEGDGVAGMWKDVTYLAMLDTEWVLRSTWRRDVPGNPVVSVWDEMFARHAREREELVRWEEKHGRVKRSSSTETLREHDGKTRDTQGLAYLTDDDATSFGNQSVYGSAPPSPNPNIFVTSWEPDELMADDFSDANLDQRWEEVRALQAMWRTQDIEGSFLAAPTSGHVLALPSIPSTHLSDVNLQSPLTIPSPTTQRLPSPSPSPIPSSTRSSWTDSDSEDNRLLEDAAPGLSAPIPTPHVPQPRMSSGLRLRRSQSGNSSSSGSTDSWSDAQSSVDTGSNGWEHISNASSGSSRGYM